MYMYMYTMYMYMMYMYMYMVYMYMYGWLEVNSQSSSCH